jgi:hypothetical protein
LRNSVDGLAGRMIGYACGRCCWVQQVVHWNMWAANCTAQLLARCYYDAVMTRRCAACSPNQTCVLNCSIRIT